ncbi:MAG: ECF-type sigma factor [Vicinamibacterales bacterium]
MSDGSTAPGHLTQLLQQWHAGDPGSLDRLVSDVYPELHAMASRYMRGGRGSTIQATMLVHDLYVRLLKQERANFPNRRAFFGFASGAMRHILIDHIRGQKADKRGADRVRVPLTEELQLVDASPAFLLDLDRALDELAAFDARKAELVQLCVFLGCGRAEAAELLDISLATAKRDFRLARAWLSRRLRIDGIDADEAND